MEQRGFTLFDTAIGRCGLAWGPHGILGVQLPEARESATRARLRARFPGTADVTPPKGVKGAIDAITALLAGERRGLEGLALDMDGVPPFHRRVYELARTIPPGETMGAWTP